MTVPFRKATSSQTSRLRQNMSLRPGLEMWPPSAACLVCARPWVQSLMVGRKGKRQTGREGSFESGKEGREGRRGRGGERREGRNEGGREAENNLNFIIHYMNKPKHQNQPSKQKIL